jgi:hypothetical protein
MPEVTMTSIRQEIGASPPMPDVMAQFEDCFRRVFGFETLAAAAAMTPRAAEARR